METVEFTYQNKPISIPAYVVDRLSSLGVTVDEEYLDNVWACRHPSMDFDPEQRLPPLVYSDMWTRLAYSDEGLGRVVAYLDEPKTYESIYAAIEDNWDNRPNLGFENLHKRGITLVAKVIEKFGVRVTSHRSSVQVDALNDCAKHIYRYKNGVAWRRLYQERKERGELDGLSLDEYLVGMAKYFCLGVGEVVRAAVERRKAKKAEASARDEKGYRKALERLLTRYSYPSGKTAFDEVDDLNDWDGYTGVYVLAFDGEKRYYVGMADKSFKKRILEHFRKPISIVRTVSRTCHQFTSFAASIRCPFL